MAKDCSDALREAIQVGLDAAAAGRLHEADRRTFDAIVADGRRRIAERQNKR